jgi:hypothetical protein
MYKFYLDSHDLDIMTNVWPAAAVRLPAMPSAGKPAGRGFSRFYI